jgi:UDP-N-acetylmuramoyl-L-alanyl-D-glutamate--2,6-diaminopimelate ligase
MNMSTLKYHLSRFVPQAFKNVFYHLPLAVIANLWFGFPSRGLTIIGVTGTNGKTTTTKCIASLLHSAHLPTAYASTIECGIRDTVTVNATKFTTLSPWQLQRFLAQAKRVGCTHVVLEISSHALDQYRVWGIAFSVAVMTNVTREHLDYHQTMDRYRAAKRQLFERAEKLIVNLDMERPEDFLVPGKPALTYSTKRPEADVFADDINLDLAGSQFFALGRTFTLQLPGLFNIENALAAIALGKLLGLSPEAIQQGLATLTGVPGRMELVPNESGADILIDYAVTPDAFEKLYAAILPMKIPGTKIIHVFGACGERDRGKRPIMGGIASRHADIIILTNEDPYHEDPERIIDDIEAGVTKKKDETYFRIFDRRAAIEKALGLAERGDIVLITGKGAEETMAIGDERVPWKERQVIEEELHKKTADAQA